MVISKSADEIANRMAEVERQLKTTEEAIAKQMALPFFSRQRDTCNYLAIQKKIIVAKLGELKWMLYE